MEENNNVPITHRHFILHKPHGYLSQFINNEQRKKRRKMLGELYDFPEGVMAIGRLDKKSEGLLLLTTNGKVSHEVTSRKVEKEYFVQVDGIIDQEAIEKMEKGVEIGFEGTRYMTKPCKAYLVEGEPDLPIEYKKIRDERHGPLSWARVIINEGKYRQVRKMTAAVGFPTLRLVRVRVGNVRLEIEAAEVVEVDAFDY